MDSFEKIGYAILAVVAAEVLAYGTAVRLRRRPIKQLDTRNRGATAT